MTSSYEIIPGFEEYRELAEQGNLVPVYAEILGDLETPVSAFLRMSDSDYAFLLESVEGGEKWARYSFLGAEPAVIFRSKGNRAEIIRGTRYEVIEGGKDALDHLKRLMAEYKPVAVPGLPRFVGGAVGYIAYDMVRYFERLPDSTVDELAAYDTHFIITDSIIVFDNVRHTMKVVVNTHLADGEDLRATYDAAVEKIRDIIAKLQEPLALEPPREYEEGLEYRSNFTREQYLEVVKKCKEYIRLGDIIQVVPSQRFRAPAKVEPITLYRALRRINPSPYMFFLKLGGELLIGSSPEVLIRVEGDLAELRPIAGTRPRGKTAAEDAKLEQDLKADPKEMAEHIMLVDLGRNDLGRVCKIGSVEVTELGIVERYSHVMHLVSNVRGRVKDGLDAYDVFRASFPAGTLTGAPKIRAMEIIEEVEPTKRGCYGGAVGYFSFTGNMDMCIAIRTMFIKDGMLNIQAGGGIVADSDPATEYEETVNKAKALMKAVGMARKGLKIE
ncbi:MAG TPA: anthranilate synthase component I [bacterium]|nr:anthranilate synthase component I [bacterium]